MYSIRMHHTWNDSEPVILKGLEISTWCNPALSHEDKGSPSNTPILQGHLQGSVVGFMFAENHAHLLRLALPSLQCSRQALVLRLEPFSTPTGRDMEALLILNHFRCNWRERPSTPRSDLCRRSMSIPPLGLQCALAERALPPVDMAGKALGDLFDI